MKRKPKLPSKEEAWTALAGRRGGTVVSNKRGKLAAVRFALAPVELVLDTYTQSNGETSQTYTRGRVLYVMRDEFRFRLYRRSIFSGLGKFLGMQDIEVGQPALDREFIIKADSEGRIRALLLRSGISNALMTLGGGRLETRPFRRRGADTARIRELRYTVPGVVREAARLDAVVDLFVEVTAHLVKSGSAWPERAPITL